jgi:hypothetical protein
MEWDGMEDGMECNVHVFYRNGMEWSGRWNGM